MKNNIFIFLSNNGDTIMNKLRKTIQVLKALNLGLQIPIKDTNLQLTADSEDKIIFLTYDIENNDRALNPLMDINDFINFIDKQLTDEDITKINMNIALNRSI